MRETGAKAVWATTHASLSYTGLILVALLFLFPFFWMVSNAIRNNDEVLAVPGSEQRLAGPEPVDLRTRTATAVPRVDHTTFLPSCVMAANRAGGTPLTRTLNDSTCNQLRGRPANYQARKDPVRQTRKDP